MKINDLFFYYFRPKTGNHPRAQSAYMTVSLLIEKQKKMSPKNPFRIERHALMMSNRRFL